MPNLVKGGLAGRDGAVLAGSGDIGELGEVDPAEVGG